MEYEIKTDIVLVDIIGFSKLSSKQQLEIVTFLTKGYKKVIEKMLISSQIPLSTLILGFVSTGDGFYCILDPKLKGFGTILGLNFSHFAGHINTKYPYFEGVKVAVHTGTVNRFIDILGNLNFIGDGLNDCSRYLEYKHFSISTVMVSDAAYEELKNFLHYHNDFEQLLGELQFKRSEEYIFYDKHENEKKGYLVWFRKSGIITPPKLDFI